jgi:hypothetical protein
MRNQAPADRSSGATAPPLPAQTDILRAAARLEEESGSESAVSSRGNAGEAAQSSARETAAPELDLDRLARIRRDYRLTKEDLYSLLMRTLTGLTADEFEGWIQEGRLDSRQIEGNLYFFNSAISNLLFRHPELNPRRFHPLDETERDQTLLTLAAAIKSAARAGRNPYVLPRRFRVAMRITAEAGAAPDGTIIRAWLPIPRGYPFQYRFKLAATSTPPRMTGGEDSPIRSVYFEQPAQANRPTEFALEYEFTTRGVHFDLKPEEVEPLDRLDETTRPFLREAPHVRFTPQIRALSANIAGQDPNPLVQARKLYHWLAERLQYSYAPEYSTIPNLSEDCLTKGYGDCGQQALLFITLCRCRGIPARWQSGWNLFPKRTAPHDWTEIHIAPYGWIPVDPCLGNHAVRYAGTLTAEERSTLRDFYFGGLDQYRMVANGDHNQPLVPPKQSPRSDEVDFQRGELEQSGGNIYFDQFTYSLNYAELLFPS